MRAPPPHRNGAAPVKNNDVGTLEHPGLQGKPVLPASELHRALWANIRTDSLAPTPVGEAPEPVQEAYDAVMEKFDGDFLFPELFTLQGPAGKSYAIEQQDDVASTLYVFDAKGTFQGSAVGFLTWECGAVVAKLPRTWNPAPVSPPGSERR